jgi:hypothetical protein
MQRPIRYYRKRRYQDLLDNNNNFSIGKQMQKRKRILAHEKTHLQLPPKLQRSKASNYHQQITIMENWKIQYTLTTTCFHLKHTIGTRNFLTNEFINIINNNVINHLITLHIINNFQEEIEAKRKIQHFLQYHQTQQIQLGNDYLRK